MYGSLGSGFRALGVFKELRVEGLGRFGVRV